MAIAFIWTATIALAALAAFSTSAALIGVALWGHVSDVQRQLLVIEAALLFFVSVKAAGLARNAERGSTELFDKFWPVNYQE